MRKSLEDFTIGKVVFWEFPEGEHSVGHVVGFGQNCHKEILVKVQPMDLYVNLYVTPGHENVVQAVKYIRLEQLKFK